MLEQGEFYPALVPVGFFGELAVQQFQGLGGAAQRRQHLGPEQHGLGPLILFRHVGEQAGRFFALAFLQVQADQFFDDFALARIFFQVAFKQADGFGFLPVFAVSPGQEQGEQGVAGKALQTLQGDFLGIVELAPGQKDGGAVLKHGQGGVEPEQALKGGVHGQPGIVA